MVIEKPKVNQHGGSGNQIECIVEKPSIGFYDSIFGCLAFALLSLF
jgi:hypothetical protein